MLALKCLLRINDVDVHLLLCHTTECFDSSCSKIAKISMNQKIAFVAGFRSLGVNEWLDKVCASLGMKHPTAVQKGCIPAILQVPTINQVLSKSTKP